MFISFSAIGQALYQLDKPGTTITKRIQQWQNAGNLMISRSKRKTEMMKALRVLVPAASLADFTAIMEIAERGHLRHLPPTITTWQAVTTHIRHNHTDYDRLLTEGYDSTSARHFVLDTMNEILQAWGATRQINDEDNG